MVPCVTIRNRTLFYTAGSRLTLTDGLYHGLLLFIIDGLIKMGLTKKPFATSVFSFCSQLIFEHFYSYVLKAQSYSLPYRAD